MRIKHLIVNIIVQMASRDIPVLTLRLMGSAFSFGVNLREGGRTGTGGGVVVVVVLVVVEGGGDDAAGVLCVATGDAYSLSVAMATAGPLSSFPPLSPAPPFPPCSFCATSSADPVVMSSRDTSRKRIWNFKSSMVGDRVCDSDAD